jgi:hypothetical protein
VYFQTYEPEAAPIVAAATHDYRLSTRKRIAHARRQDIRHSTGLVRLVYRHGKQQHALEESARVASELRIAQTRRAGRAGYPRLHSLHPEMCVESTGTRWSHARPHPSALLEKVRLGDNWHVDIDPASLL